MKKTRHPRYARHRFPAEVISHAVWLYFRFPLSLRMVEEMLAARGILVSHETGAAVGAEVRPELCQPDPPASSGTRRQMASGRCVTNTFLKEEVWSCTRDEGGPLEVGSQVQASNPCKLRASRATVVSVAEKAGLRFRQVRSGEASESEPLMTCRNAKGDVKTGGSSSFRDQFGGCPEDCPSGIRHVGGAKPDQALVWNVRTCRPDAKGDVQAAKTARTRVPMRGTGAEQPVVGRKVL